METKTSNQSITCPRCLSRVKLRIGDDNPRFCPRCGLEDVAAASSSDPISLAVGPRTYRIEQRIAFGDLCNIYQCRFDSDGREIHGFAKVARDARQNQLLDAEATVLRRLQAADTDGRFSPFYPAIEDSFTLEDPDSRRVNILQMHPGIQSADELYSLAEVRAHYTSGIDPRDAAWMYRRVLNALGFAHQLGIAHGAVTPSHVLIEPREHKLVLIDWCFASPGASPLIGRYRDWYPYRSDGRGVPSPGLDISMAARCMIDVLGGDAVNMTFPAGIDSGLKRHFERCLAFEDRPTTSPIAWKLLEDFDRLIEALWGERKFREFTMPRRIR